MILTWLRAWRLWIVVLALSIQVTATTLWPSSAVSVPGREDVQAVIWPLSPVILGVALPTVLKQGYLDVRQVAAGWQRDRLELLAFISLASLFPVAAASEHEQLVLLRNTGLVIGLCLLATTFLPSAASWLPPTLGPMAMWLLGTHSLSPPDRWALLLQDRDEIVSRLVAGFLMIAGGTAYLTRRRRVRG